MRLYTFFRSSAAYRVRIALAVKGLAYESLPLHLRRAGGEHRKPQYLARNPQGLVPALEVVSGGPPDPEPLSHGLRAIRELLDAPDCVLFSILHW